MLQHCPGTRVCWREQGELRGSEESVSPSLSAASGKQAGGRRGGRTYVLLHHSGDRCDGHLGRCAESAWRTTTTLRSLARVEAATDSAATQQLVTRLSITPLAICYACDYTYSPCRLRFDALARLQRPVRRSNWPTSLSSATSTTPCFSPSLRRPSCVLELVPLPAATRGRYTASYKKRRSNGMEGKPCPAMTSTVDKGTGLQLCETGGMR